MRFPSFVSNSVPRLLRGLIGAGFTLSAATAHAQAPTRIAPPSRDAVEFAFDLGYTRHGSPHVRPDAARVGFLLAYYATPRLAATFDLLCSGGVPAGLGDADSFALCTGSLGASLDVAVGARWRPYARASVGQAQRDDDAAMDVYDIDARGLAYTAALGVRHVVGTSGRAALRAEVALERHDLLGGTSTDLSAGFGFAWRMR